MIIPCPQCHRTFDIPLEDLFPEGKSFRCSGCQSVFFQPAPQLPPPVAKPSPPPSPPPVQAAKPSSLPGDQRQHRRDSFFARAQLRLTSGKKIQADGIIEDISATGAAFTPHNSHDLDEMASGDTGILEVVVHESRKPAFIEIPCEVARATPETAGLRFIDPDSFKRGSDPSRTFRPRTSSMVYVRRSDGSLDGGWELLPTTARLPTAIQGIFIEKQQETLCIVCRKVVASGVGYKVYTLLDLKVIQEEAESFFGSAGG